MGAQSKLLRVQEYLQTKSLSDLKRDHGVKHRIVDHKVSLNYDQIESKHGDKLAGECRGLILRRTTNNTIDPDEIFGESRVLACAFPRFYNMAESCAEKIDWETARIQEKLDGTLTILYYDNIKKEWHVATRSVPEANLDLQGFDFTFRDLFEMGLEEYGFTFDDFVEDLIPGYTYVFELCSPYNRIVVSYPKTKLVLLSVRENWSLEELSLEMGIPFKDENYVQDQFPMSFVNFYYDEAWEKKKEKYRSIQKAKEYSLSSPDEIVQFVNDQDPTMLEGVVIVDDAWRRVKVKSLSYVSFNRARDKLGASYRNCLCLVLEGKVDDCIGKLPEEIEKILLDMQEEVSVFIKFHEEYYEDARLQSIDEFGDFDMKQFAMIVQEGARNFGIWAGPMFNVARGKSETIGEAIRKKNHDGKYNTKALDNILEAIGYG